MLFHSVGSDDEKESTGSRRGKRKRVVGSRAGTKRTRRTESESEENSDN